MFPHPLTPTFMSCMDWDRRWRCPNCGGQGGHWYMGEVVPGDYATVALSNDESSRTTFSLEEEFMQLPQEGVKECAVAAKAAVEEQMEVE